MQLPGYESRDSAAALRRRVLIVSSVGAVAGLCFAAGIDALWQHAHADVPRPYRAGSGALLALAGLWQFRVAFFLWRRDAEYARVTTERMGWIARWFLVGATLAYCVALALGPDPHLRYAVRATWALAYTALLLCVVSPVGARWQQHRHGLRRGRRLAGRLVAGVAVVVAAEAALQGYAWFSNRSNEAAWLVRRQAHLPGSQWHDQSVNQQGYCDQEFAAQRQPGVFRIAALGDSTALENELGARYLQRLEEQLAATEIYNFALPMLGPREYAAQVASDVCHCRPDLVLLFVSVADDITQPLAGPSDFDWRSVQLCQWGLRWLAPAGSSWHGRRPLAASAGTGSLSAELRAPELRVCLRPMPETVSAQWSDALAALRRAHAVCCRDGVASALVLVPAGFQVVANGGDSAVSCAFVPAEQLDLELPQRRLLAFAAREQWPALDLLPAMRRAHSMIARADDTVPDQPDESATRAVASWVRQHFADEYVQATTIDAPTPGDQMASAER